MTYRGLRQAVIKASACICGARIGYACRRRGKPALNSPHPSRLRRAAERFPHIAAALQAEQPRRRPKRAARRKLKSPKTRRRVAELLRSGVSIAGLARRFHVCPKTIRKTLREIATKARHYHHRPQEQSTCL